MFFQNDDFVNSDSSGTINWCNVHPGRRGRLVIVGPSSDLGAEAVREAAAAGRMEGCWGKASCWGGGEECAARSLGSEPDANYNGLGVLVPHCLRHLRKWGVGGRGRHWEWGR